MRSFSRIASKTLPQPPIQDLSIASNNVPQDSLIAALSSPDFDPNEFIANNLGNTDISNLAMFSEKLKQQAQKYGDGGVSSVEKTHFALNSLTSNVSKVAPLVAELHKEISELSLVTSAMRQDAYAKRNADARRTSNGSQDLDNQDTDEVRPVDIGKRQSVLALNALWAADLNEFHVKIENSQKFIPSAKGRHIVLESEGWVELNLVNQQPVKSLLVILLNDFLVLARNNNGRFQLDHYYNLKDQLEVKIVQNNTIIVGQNADARGLLAPSKGKLRQLHTELVKLCSLQQKNTHTSQQKQGDSSAIVNWSKSQIDLYAQAFNRQLFKISPELKGYQRCREVSRLESQQLKSLKMEMEFMLRYVWDC
ncbi:hypothetical protein FF38_12717, partial [Lucilia cuprina]